MAKRITDTTIGKLYYNEVRDIFPANEEEPTAGDDFIEKFFNTHEVSKELHNAIEDLSTDYMASKLPFAFYDGFKLGARLMLEVLSDE